MKKLFNVLTKNVIYLVLFLIITNSFVSAQIKTEQKQKYKLFSSIGIFAGADLSYLTGDAPNKAFYEGKTGYLGGISVEFNITKDFKILLQPSYSLRNTKILFDVALPELRDSLLVKFSYFRVPVLVKINAFNGVTYFLSGLNFGYQLSTQLSKLDNPSEETDISNLVNKFDLSAMFGFGVNFRIKSSSLYLELRYSQGLLNMSNNDVNKFESYLPTRFRIAGLQLLTGFNFNL